MEMNFFTSFNNNYLGLKNKVQFIPFCCNIYALYQEMKKYDFDIDTEKAILLSPSISEEKKASIKDVKFESKYLVFDFDFQENSLSDETKIEALYEMIRIFNNDSENGLLLLNYPMFESFEERITSGDDFEEKKVLKNNLICYKQSIQNRKLYLDCTHQNTMIFAFSFAILYSFPIIFFIVLSKASFLFRKWSMRGFKKEYSIAKRKC